LLIVSQTNRQAIQCKRKKSEAMNTNRSKHTRHEKRQNPHTTDTDRSASTPANMLQSFSARRTHEIMHVRVFKMRSIQIMSS